MTADQIAESCRAILARGSKPTLPDVEPLVDAYYALPGNGAGGSLHIVLDDGNCDRGSVEWSRDYARREGDSAGEHLGEVLLLLSNSQRRRL